MNKCKVRLRVVSNLAKKQLSRRNTSRAAWRTRDTQAARVSSESCDATHVFRQLGYFSPKLDNSQVSALHAHIHTKYTDSDGIIDKRKLYNDELRTMAQGPNDT